jgi:hypothetical protein
LFLFFRIDSTETCSADKISHMHGLLYSQIGYDLGLPMRALIRASARGHVSDNTPFALIDGHDATVLSGAVRYWGQIWGEHWWICDFSALNAPGDYTLRIGPPGDPLYPDAMISVGAHLLFERTAALVGIGQFEERQRRARNDSGWKDCGHFWREANSHASTLIGMCDLLAYGFEWLSPSERARLVRQIVTGCDYLAQLQDYAAMVGHPDGAIAHELPNFPMLIPGDQAQSAVALIRSARLVFEMHPDKAADYLRRGERAYLYLTRAMRPIGQTGFSASNHGAPSGYQVPDEFTTRDLMMTLWAAEELWISGKWAYKDEVVALAARIIDRQVPESAAEDGLHGHFYAFSDRAFSEKANTHHHIGHDTGGTFPHYLVALIDMCKRWDDHPDAPRWRLAVERFARGYLIPACTRNPFSLLPMGVWPGQGLLTFCGPWHGANVSIAFAATLAAQLWMFLGDDALRDIATGNLQWIAGLNSGLTRESFGGCVIWRMPEDFPDGVALPHSQIVGVGQRSVGAWTDITGTIPNGFCTNPQFQLVVEPTVANDSPRLWTDEDWIPHSGAWISALATLRDVRFFKG